MKLAQNTYLILLFVLLAAMSPVAHGMSLSLRGFAVDPFDIRASSQPRLDLNGNACALVVVELPVPGCVFQGNVVGTVDFEVNEYLVYVTQGTKQLRIKCPGFETFTAELRDTDNGTGVEGRHTYRLLIAGYEAALAWFHPQTPAPEQKKEKPSASPDPTPVRVEPKHVATTKLTGPSQPKVSQVEKMPLVGEIDGHAYVDLGLPSGTLWATTNLGANNPWDYGDFFAWGDIEPKKDYLYLGTGSPGGNIIGNKGRDAATNKWGDNWQLPSKTQLYELTELCKWEKTTMHGRVGFSLTGLNGNSIFIPLAGYKFEKKHNKRGERFGLWAGHNDDAADAWALEGLDIGAGGYVYRASRHNGYSIRPVSNKKNLRDIADSGNLVNGHEYVDLGLPSGLKWATMNIGATKPEDFGERFAWGEVETKDFFNESNYGLPQNYIYNISFSEKDAALNKWGSPWRLSLPDDFKELMDFCTWTWEEINGINGYRIEGPNGNTIFLPATGLNDSVNGFRNEKGFYWTGEHFYRIDNRHYLFDATRQSQDFEFSKEKRYFNSMRREKGLSIRPVLD